MAERTYVDAQIAFKVMLNVLIFPIICSWVWGGGWLSSLGYLDYGGSGFHIVGGTCGLVGANFVGARLGLFKDTLPIYENKVLEKITKKSRGGQTLQVENVKKMKKQRLLIAEYLSY